MTKEKICGIYCIENITNNKMYIGLSTNIYKRWNKHKRMLNNNEHPNEHLQLSWNIHGEDSFTFKIIEQCEKDILGPREEYYINYFKTQNNKHGYNRTSGGEGVQNLDVESIDKLSKSKTLYPIIRLNLCGEFICEYRNCHYAANDVGGSSENIRTCCNKKHGHKTAYGSIWMYKVDYEKNGCNFEDYIYHQFTKPIIQYDLNMNYIAEYESAREAEIATGIGYKMISRVCNYKRSHTYGFIFRFKS